MNRYLLSVLLGLALSTSPFASSLDEGSRLKNLESLVTHLIKDQSMVGIASGHLESGRPHFYNFGETKLGNKISPSQNDYFEMGSITKTFTATMLAREILLNRVKLTTTVGELWPELKEKDVAKVTLEQLATHSSGLPRMPDNFAPTDPQNPYKDYDEGALFAFLQSFQFEKPVPTQLQVSLLFKADHLYLQNVNKDFLI